MPNFPNFSVFQVWGLLIPVIYVAFNLLLRIINIWSRPTKKLSRSSDILAYIIVSQLVFIYFVVPGIMAWFNIGEVDLGEAKNDRIFGRSEFIEYYILIPMLWYQFWNFVFCCIFAEMRTVGNIIHHLSVFAIACLCLFPFIQYWSIFFFGIVEISSIPLNVMDFLKYMPEGKTRYPLIYDIHKAVFAFLFVGIRLIAWPYYFIKACYIDYELFHSFHPAIIIGFLSASALLTGLQIMWGLKIIEIFFVTMKNIFAGENKIE